MRTKRKACGMLALSGSIRTNAAASMKPAPAATKYRSGACPLRWAVTTSTAPARSAAAASVENGQLTVATADPLNPVVVDDLRQFTGLAVKLVVSSAEAITEAIDRTYDGAATPLQRIVDGMEDERKGEGEEDVNQLRDMAF